MMMDDDSDKHLRAFGFRVRALRNKRGISQENLADLCELDRSYIGGVERGERNISLNNIIKICDALEVSVPVFFKGWLDE